MSLSITVKNSQGARFEMQIPSLSETVAEFKRRLETSTGIPAASQRLIFRGHILKDAHTFADVKAAHGLESGHSMHVVPSPQHRTSAADNSSSNSTQSQGVGGGGQGPSIGRGGATPGPDTGAGGMGGMPGLGGMGGWPDMMEMQQQMMRNPQQMQALMNSPIMENIMNNPQVARSLMMANPQMRELLERNPEVAHVFNDPATFRQMMQMARNPSLMNEMMRNTDRQMANIEMMPGGFDALRRMHENIQAPMMDAAQGFAMGNDANPRANVTDDNPFTALFEQNIPSNAPMPNPWAPAGGVPQPTMPTPTTTPLRANPPAAVDSGANAFAQLFQAMPGLNNSATTGTGAGTGTAPAPAPGTGTTPSPIPGLEGMGLPNGANADSMLQMLENPMMQQMMQNVLGDPQLFQSMIASDPNLQARIQSNPEMARLLQNPELMRSFLNPEVMRGVRQIQNALAGSNTPAEGAQTTGTTPTGGMTGGATTNGTAGIQGMPGNNPTGTGVNWNTADPMAALDALFGTRTGTTPVQPAANAATGTATENAAFGQRSGTAGVQGMTGNDQTGTRGANLNPTDPGAFLNAMFPRRTGTTPTQPAENGAFGQRLGESDPPRQAHMERDFRAMMNAFAAAQGGTVPPDMQMTQEELEEMYSSQLQQLREMGFLDKATCLQALQQSRGNVSAAIENLLSRFGG